MKSAESLLLQRMPEGVIDWIIQHYTPRAGSLDIKTYKDNLIEMPTPLSIGKWWEKDAGAAPPKSMNYGQYFLVDYGRSEWFRKLDDMDEDERGAS